MRKLVFTMGSPGSRAVRIVLHELGLTFDPVATDAGAPPDLTPAMQVPCLIDDGQTLWEAPLIVEYLLSLPDATPDTRHRQSARPLSKVLVRPEHEWDDKLALASAQTFGTSVTTISQMRWSGVKHFDNEFLGRCAQRLDHLLDWFERRIDRVPIGLFKDAVAIQDVLLVCWLDFVDHRPLDIEWRSAKRPNMSVLFEELTHRESFVGNPIEWWEPA